MNIRILKRMLLAGLLLLSACGGSGGGQPADTTLPVIASVSGISQGGSYSGSVTITALATDDVGVSSFSISVDSSQIHSAAGSNLSYSWDTTALGDGSHTVLLRVRDAAGNEATRSFTLTIDNSGGGGPTGTVTGTVYAPNGSDPVSEALVYVPNGSASAVGDPPGVGHHAFAYSAADGSFTLSGVPTGEQSIVMEKGAFSKSVSFTVGEGPNSMAPGDTTLSSAGAADMLVVTGQYDHIENVLAKLGLGDFDGDGRLILGTEQFMLVDAANRLDDAEYMDFDDFWMQADPYAPYRTVFLNCGNDFEDDFLADSAAVEALRQWVEDGGRLYCTDWSYDFIEQLWPEYISFETVFGDTGDGFTAITGMQNEAQQGGGADAITADIAVTEMADWMEIVGATSASAQFSVVDWLPAWAVINDVSAEVDVWATGEVSFGFPQQTATRPLTISFDVVSGSILYSSYHTEDVSSTDLTPQDRVLQYLIFEVL